MIERYSWKRAGGGVYLTRIRGQHACAMRIDTPKGAQWVSLVDGDMLPGAHARAFDAKRAVERRVIGDMP